MLSKLFLAIVFFLYVNSTANFNSSFVFVDRFLVYFVSLVAKPDFSHFHLFWFAARIIFDLLPLRRVRSSLQTR